MMCLTACRHTHKFGEWSTTKYATCTENGERARYCDCGEKQSDSIPAKGVDLQLSGHTHGGQFFFLFPLVSHINRGFRSGLYCVGGMALHVSPGTGMWGYAPMRWGCRSEISLLTLTS